MQPDQKIITNSPLVEVEADESAEARLRKASVLIIASAFAFFFAIAWANWAELEQVSRGTGQIIASSKTQVIQAPDGGVIEELNVREGDLVSKGQVLAKLDHSRAEAAFKEIEAKRLGLLNFSDSMYPVVYKPELGDQIRPAGERAADMKVVQLIQP